MLQGCEDRVLQAGKLRLGRGRTGDAVVMQRSLGLRTIHETRRSQNQFSAVGQAGAPMCLQAAAPATGATTHLAAAAAFTTCLAARLVATGHLAAVGVATGGMMNLAAAPTSSQKRCQPASRWTHSPRPCV